MLVNEGKSTDEVERILRAVRSAPRPVPGAERFALSLPERGT